MKKILLLLLMFNFFLYSCDSGSSDNSAPDTDIEQPDKPDDDKNPDRENYLTPNVDSEGKIIVNYTPKEYVETVEEGQHMMSVRIPDGYYTSASTLSGAELREELMDIISTGAIALEYTSSSSYDVWDMCEAGDQNPADERQVWQIYTETGRAKNDHSAGVSDEWNREHVWAKSHGDFGKDKGAGTDGHHLRASYSRENSTRGNKNFGDVSGARTYNTEFYEPPLSAKGDVARMIFYMAVRYGFKVDNLGTVSKEARMGKLEDLLKWNELDPVDPYEIRRNNIIYDFQKNRNPFIDHPELVKYVFGDKKDAAWKE